MTLTQNLSLMQRDQVTRKPRKNSVSKEVNKIAVHVDSTESSSQESELMKQINAADLKQNLLKLLINL
jgi:hypothetical protein